MKSISRITSLETSATWGTEGIVSSKSDLWIVALAEPERRSFDSTVIVTWKVTGCVISRIVRSPVRVKV